MRSVPWKGKEGLSCALRNIFLVTSNVSKIMLYKYGHKASI